MLSRNFLCIYLWRKSAYTCLYRCTPCKYIFTFYNLGINLQVLLHFRIFCWPDTQCELWRKAKFWEDSRSQDDKTQLEGKQYKSDYEQQSFVLQLYEVTLENLRNYECFEFKSTNINIASANDVIKRLKSICLYPSVLMVGLYQTHWNEITKLVSITFGSMTSVGLDLKRKPK